MERKKYDINKDWEITMPFRILWVFLLLMFSATMITHPGMFSSGFDSTWLGYLKIFATFAIYLFAMVTALQRIRHKETAGAFLVIDYAIVGSGLLTLAIIGIGLLIWT